jgi:phytoene dehydrogenase-like protein
MKPTVVIGGGHNGMTAATWLAKAGEKVVLLEARDVLGGLAARESFHKGYAVAGVHHDTRTVRPAIVDALGLERHGLAWRNEATAIAAPGEDGTVWLRGDRVEGAGDEEAVRYQRWRAFIARVRPALAKMLDRSPPDPAGDMWPLLEAGVKMRLLGKDDMLELLRVMPMCVGDWMRDSFTDERLMAALALPAVEGCYTGPWSAGTAANLLLREIVAGREIEGGAAALVDALAKAARAHGVDVRLSSRVKRIVVSRGAATAVELADGEVIDCARIFSSCDPKQTFLTLVGEQRLPVRFARAIRNVRTRGTTAHVRLALDQPLLLADGSEVEMLRTGESLNAIERAFDAAKYRSFAERPVLEVRVHREGYAPAGHASASLVVHAAAYDRRDGWSDDAREALGDAAVDVLARHCPKVKDHIVAREVLSPVDIQQRYGVTGGHIHHGEHALDQLLFMRPTVECANYATPIAGLILCGSGSHPGGGLTCAPGALAAKSLLR